LREGHPRPEARERVQVAVIASRGIVGGNEWDEDVRFIADDVGGEDANDGDVVTADGERF
jgi:hypothetical protein